MATLPPSVPAYARLPFEIMEMIIGHIEHGADLYAWALTCKAIYYGCNGPDRTRIHTVTTGPDCKCRGRREFMQLMEIIENPGLIKYVYYLSIDHQAIFDLPFVQSGPERKMKFSEIRILRRAAKEAGFTYAGGDLTTVLDMLMQQGVYEKTVVSYSDRTRQATRQMFIGQAIGALLLAKCTKLERLTIGTRALDDLTWQRTPPATRYPLDHIMRTIHSNPLGCNMLQKLRKLRLLPAPPRSNLFYRKTNINGCIEIFERLPCLEVILAEGMSWKNPICVFRKDTCNAKGVFFTRCKFGTDVLAQTLLAVAELERFTYSTGKRQGNPGDGDANEFNPRTLLLSLLRHRATLRVLDLDCDAQVQRPLDGKNLAMKGFSDDGKRTQGPFFNQRGLLEPVFAQRGNLADLSALTHLTIGSRLLVLFVQGVPASPSTSTPTPTTTSGPGSSVPAPAPTINKRPHQYLLEALPETLKVLTIRGFWYGDGREAPETVAFVEVVAALRPNLKVYGIDELEETSYDFGRLFDA